MATTSIDVSTAYRALASDPVIVAVTQALSTTYALSALARSAHWNVIGATFNELHELFGAIYEDADEAVDNLAERIRQLGGFVTVDLAVFQAQAGIAQPVPPKVSTEWLVAVLAGLDKTISDLARMKSVAGAAGDLDVQDLAVQQSQLWKKARWKVSATLR